MVGQSAEWFFTPADVDNGRVEIEMRGALETGLAKDERWHQRMGFPAWLCPRCQASSSAWKFNGWIQN